ncbi:MAG: hypothetical protein OIF35_07980 [Cellvibrionaceae bacterium]|nr:hypothetical protein [Cellvibrionaceae bacterium]MCV6625869.1 hypothetical protein [Cellvibrionaceae bacterium]
MKTTITLLFTVLALSLSNISLAKDCKGQAKTACGKAGSCSWVDPYTRKDGKKVKGYCRASSGKAKSAAKDKTAESKATAKSKSKSKAQSKAKAQSKPKAEKSKAKNKASKTVKKSSTSKSSAKKKAAKKKS